MQNLREMRQRRKHQSIITWKEHGVDCGQIASLRQTGRALPGPCAREIKDIANTMFHQGFIHWLSLRVRQKDSLSVGVYSLRLECFYDLCFRKVLCVVIQCRAKDCDFAG